MPEELATQINKAYRDHITIIWNILINRLSTIPRITVNKSVLEMLNGWEGNETWPTFLNKWSRTPSNLILYKGYEFNMSLAIGSSPAIWQVCKINFDNVSTTHFREKEYYTHDGPSQYSCARNLILTLRDIQPCEKKGKLTKEEVIITFGDTYTMTHYNSINWRIHEQSLETLVEKLETRHKKLTTADNKTKNTKAHDKLYERYLANRWPVVENLIKLHKK